MIWNTPFWELQNLGTTRLFTSQGIFGGYPGSVAYIHNIRDNNLRELAEAGEAYPVADGPFDEPALMAIDGERELQARQLHPARAVRRRRPLPLGDEGRPPGSATRSSDRRRRSSATSPRATSLPSFAEPVYARLRPRRALARGGSSAPGRRAEWWAAERERVLAGELIEPVKVGYEESMKLSPRWAAEFRGFWDLPEDFEFEVATPTLPADRAREAGEGDARGVGGRVPGRLRASRASSRRARRERRSSARRSRRCSTRSSRGARSRRSSRATRTRTGSTSGSRSCRSGWPATTRSCCRWARAL